MTESFVTQCPHCQTRFRVTRAQLGMARGAVRCGACLQVFNAAEQLGEPAASPVPPPAPAAPAPGMATAAPAGDAHSALGGTLAAAGTALAVGMADDAAAPGIQPAGYTPAPLPSPPDAAAARAPAEDEPLWIHDDLDLDNLDLDLDEELAKLDQDSFELSSEFRDYQPSRAPFGDPLQAPRDPHDESWVEALLVDQPSPPARPLEAASPPPAAPSAAAGPRLVDEPPLELDTCDEDFPELEDDEQELAIHPHEALTAERDEPISISAAAATLAGASAAGAAAGQRSEPRLRDEGLLSLNDEPLQLDWQPPRTSWTRRLLWLLLILAALGGLAGQYLYYNFDTLARHERLRPWFEKVCPLLGCSLPPRVDVSLVKSSNLTVRSHPRHPGALIVDAHIYNRADFPQPFPLLELRFEDINGQPLASRSFKPSEYISGELAGQADMPPQTPIHIGLEIVDPGTQAVNYRLDFHSPD